MANVPRLGLLGMIIYLLLKPSSQFWEDEDERVTVKAKPKLTDYAYYSTLRVC
jgi:hypothetical protein